MPSWANLEDSRFTLFIFLNITHSQIALNPACPLGWERCYLKHFAVLTISQQLSVLQRRDLCCNLEKCKQEEESLHFSAH